MTYLLTDMRSTAVLQLLLHRINIATIIIPVRKAMPKQGNSSWRVVSSDPNGIIHVMNILIIMKENFCILTVQQY